MLAQPVFMTLLNTSKILGLPRDWLTREAEAGRIPHIVIGKQMYFNTEVVAECIITMMKQNASAVDDEPSLIDDSGMLPSGLKIQSPMPMNYDMPPMRPQGDRGPSGKQR
jgi:hypothetical protein